MPILQPFHGEPPRTTSRLWPDFATGPWLLRFDWAVIEGRAECVGFLITSTEPEGMQPHELGPPADALRRLTADQLRKVNLGALIDEERREWAEGWRRLGEVEVAEAFEAPLGRRHPHDPPVRLRQAADIYRGAYLDGNPTKAVAEAMTISRSAAGKLVARARAAGLLPPTSQGRPRGTHTTTSEDSHEQ